MFTRNQTAMFMSIGLLALAGVTGCKHNKSQTCNHGYAQNQYAPYRSYDYGYPQPDSQYRTAPAPEYKIVPEDQLHQPPVPAPAPDPKRTVPPSKLESSSPNGQPRNSAQYQRPYQQNIHGYSPHNNSYSPVDPTASGLNLVPRLNKKPGFFQPVGRRVRHVLGTMKNSFPKLGELNQNQKLQKTGYVASRKQQNVSVSNFGNKLTNPQQTASRVMQHQRPANSTPRAVAQPNQQMTLPQQVYPTPNSQGIYPATTWNTQQVEQPTYQPVSRTVQNYHFPQQGFAPVPGTGAMSNAPYSQNSMIETWPHAKPQPYASAALPVQPTFPSIPQQRPLPTQQRSLSTVPPQGLGL